MKLFSGGMIYFIDGKTENIKYALANAHVVLVTADSGTYKICNAWRPDYEVSAQLSYYPIREYCVFKWNDEIHAWISYTYLNYVECWE